MSTSVTISGQTPPKGGVTKGSATKGGNLVKGTAKGEQGQYLTFSLRNEMFGIGILSIKEILEYGRLTTVPMTPDFIRGVINLRGAVVPVVDLAARFNGKVSDITKRSCIVIIEVATEGGKLDIGVVVDAVSAVLEIPDTEIEPPPAFGAKVKTDFIRGMGKVEGSFVILLDVDRILSVDELTIISQTAGVTPESAVA